MMVEGPLKRSNVSTWIAGFFGLGIVVSAAFLTGFLGGGSSPAKPKPKVTSPAVTRQETLTQSPVSSSTYDPGAGEAALAKLWSNLEPAKLAEITKDWKSLELARIITRMKPEKQSDLLAELPADRASALSREIQRLTSNRS